MPSTPPQIPTPARPERRMLLGAGLALMGLAIGGLAYGLARSAETDDIEQAFAGTVATQAAEIEKDLLAFGEALYSLRALYDSSTEVTREEFATFAAEPLRRLGALRALAWAPAVDEDDREQHVASARRAGFPDYQIRDRDGNRSQTGRLAFPVYFVEPKADGLLPIGLDLGSQGVFGAAMARAAVEDEPILSDPVAGRGGAPSVALMFLRVRDRATTQVAGFVVLAFRPAELFPGARPDDATPTLALELSDPDASGARHVLGEQGVFASGRWTAVADVRAASQTWHLAGQPSPAFLAAERSWIPFLMAVLAVLAWAVLVGLAFHFALRGREDALRKHDRAMRRILASLDEGVIVVDSEGRTQFFNAAAERILGRGAEIGISGSWSSALGVFEVDSQTSFPEEAFPLARALAGETVPEREVLVRDLGETTRRWVSVSGAPLVAQNGKRNGALIVLRDVSQKKRSQQAIRRLSRAVNHTADAVYIADAKGELIYVNPAFERMTGYARRDAVGGSFKAVGLGGGDPEDFVRLSAAILSGTAFRGTTANEHRDGSVYHGEQTLTPMLDARGRLTHWVGVCRDMTENRRIEEQRIEMELASDVQRKLYPVTAPRMRGFEIAGAVFSAEATCGDYFDFIEQSDSRVAIAVGDVSGHGLGPALVMTQVRACLRTYLELGIDLDEAFERINLMLHEDFDGDFFVTLLVIVLDLETRTMQYCNAGHIPAFVLDAEGRTKATLERTGIPLGVLADRGYEIGSGGQLQPGDVALLLTDGVVESRSKDGDCLWEDGALEVVRSHIDAPAADMVERLYERVRKHARGRSQDDDVTMVVLKAIDESATYVRAADKASELPAGARGTIARRAV
ncbi:MAG: SpoIIE family protein phosphatase [Planctomycetota bacterium]|nr:SpoIIE family protein phosphatase [Planctomycetota bacterium]